MTMADDRTVFRRRSAHQDIHLFEDANGELGLTLDGYWQFHTSDERAFHQVLAEVPMCLAPEPRKVLVLGGGDGLLLRHVLAFSAVESVVLCELDGEVVEMTRTVPEMRALTRAALDDPRVQVVIDDARNYVQETSDRFDVIICDFPAPTSEELAGLFSETFFSTLRPRLADGGVLMVQVSVDPGDFWPILGHVAASFEWQAPLLLELVPDGTAENWADFIVASRSPARARRPPASREGPLSRPWSDYRIENRSGTTFVTRAYGKQDFSGNPG